ncbi:hypothetical protein, partial [Actinomadura sp. KC06]|uniref:hypothetical protein n=1 Tax=Actinomadura sp. KC06 TaxID=2530369 RepID=UPI001AA0092A
KKPPTNTPAPGQPHRSPPGTSSSPGSPNSAALADLCRTYQGKAKNGKPKSSTASPRVSASEFAQLAAAAGGPEKVADYCAKTLPGKQHKKKPDDPPKKKPKDPENEKKKKKGTPKKPKKDSRK